MKYDARACHFNMDTGCVELLLRDGRKISIDCTGVEDALDVTMAQRAELDYLIYNDPLGYANLILNGDSKEYLKNVAPWVRNLNECWTLPFFALEMSSICFLCWAINLNEIFILPQLSLQLFYLFHANLYAHG